MDAICLDALEILYAVSQACPDFADQAKAAFQNCCERAASRAPAEATDQLRQFLVPLAKTDPSWVPAFLITQ